MSQYLQHSLHIQLFVTVSSFGHIVEVVSNVLRVYITSSLLCPVTNQPPKLCIYSFALGMVKHYFLFANIMIFFTDSANVERHLRDEVFDKGRNTCISQNRLS